ncbi:hypothetical protein BOTBODRAFT_58087 [Botryobasidium botryosum FD-172 SS1]|uniref:Wings apart-like protein C-terminal domain-containing protein n=1 Tax=Botryobasidium botryosum (strain FD-172 SS1) TaxID=930990 RepID=A0A067M6P8_BOTB1|nr:hypothetical protein BOTBODRAFT_58087 [Botryobasidium botryosum FD-172 SS1]
MKSANPVTYGRRGARRAHRRESPASPVPEEPEPPAPVHRNKHARAQTPLNLDHHEPQTSARPAKRSRNDFVSLSVSAAGPKPTGVRSAAYSSKSKTDLGPPDSATRSARTPVTRETSPSPVAPRTRRQIGRTASLTTRKSSASTINDSSRVSSRAPSPPEESPSTAPPPISPFSILDDLSPAPSTSALQVPVQAAPRPGVAKRMLARTRTQPADVASTSNDPSPPSSLGSLGRTSSLPTYTLSQTPKEDDSQPLPQLDTTPLPMLQNARPSIQSQRTYSKSRSFLVSLPASTSAPSIPSVGAGAGAGGDGDIDDEELGRESYNDLRARWGVDRSEDGLLGPEATEIRSISQLRHKGETRRFLDEVGYLFEGFQSGMTIAVKRLSAIEILRKMCEVEFVRKAKAADRLVHAWDSLRNVNEQSSDKILEICLVIFAGLIARDQRDVDELVRMEGFPKFMTIMIGRSRNADPLGFTVEGERGEEARRLGIAKQDRILLESLREIVRRGDIFPDDDSDAWISTRRLVSHVLITLPPTFHHRPSLLRPLLSSILAELEPLSSRIDSYTSGLPILPSPPTYDTPDLKHADACLRLLDGIILLSAAASSSDDGVDGDDEEDVQDGLQEHGEELVRGLFSLCAVAQVLLFQEGKDAKAAGMSFACLVSGLRILVSLADSSPQWCSTMLAEPLCLPNILRLIVIFRPDKKFDCSSESNSKSRSKYRAKLGTRVGSESPKKAESKIGEGGEGEAGVGESGVDVDMEANKMDILCLALALLTHLVQSTSHGSGKLRDSVAFPSCKMRRGCARTCHCSQSIGALDFLVGLYVDLAQARANNDTIDGEVHFIRGHVSVLLGLLSQRDASTRSAILNTLPGSSPRTKLDALIAAIREFTTFYGELAKRMAEAVAHPHSDDMDMDDIDKGGGDRDDSISLSTAPALGTDFGNLKIIEDERMSRTLAREHDKGSEVANGVVAFLESLRDA